MYSILTDKNINLKEICYKWTLAGKKYMHFFIHDIAFNFADTGNLFCNRKKK